MCTDEFAGLYLGLYLHYNTLAAIVHRLTLISKLSLIININAFQLKIIQ